uniref:Histone acetyltransferase n=1 Tax=Aureoumbra lagunensis TaxID=44058 RepID=A0A7S3JTT6_9STRA|mmetsp:Transcript_9608/g.13301  ORF Transcript_9608/g.13301 Transcript_9608/m.13301 type:complete len:498 (+) Transcript_9608:102-1595(+)
MPKTRGSSKAPRPMVGSIISVCRDDETIMMAEVLEVNERYYVHYLALDRRMDEWIDGDQIQMNAPISPNICDSPISKSGNKRHRCSTDSLPTLLNRGHGPPKRNRSLSNSETRIAEKLEAAREAMTRVKNVPSIVFSEYEVETWYWSPFPEEYHGSKLYICDYTLRYTSSKEAMKIHAESYQGPFHPPGRQVYCGDDGISLWETFGKEEQLYCQNLCLISKLFLDHKTLYYDVDPFIFYVLTQKKEEHDDEDVSVKKKQNNESHHRVLGYFSKEIHSLDGYNLSCILTFPQYQRNGYGTLLISLSYELSKLENKQGSPEKPLSDLGKLSYRSYWTWTILNSLRDACDRATQKINKHNPSSSTEDSAISSSNSSTSEPDEEQKKIQCKKTDQISGITAVTKPPRKGRRPSLVSSNSLNENLDPHIACLTLDELGRSLGIRNEDICSTLHQLNMLRQWKGQTVIRAHRDEIEQHIRAIKRPPRLCQPHNMTDRRALLKE